MLEKEGWSNSTELRYMDAKEGDSPSRFCWINKPTSVIWFPITCSRTKERVMKAFARQWLNRRLTQKIVAENLHAWRQQPRYKLEIKVCLLQALTSTPLKQQSSLSQMKCPEGSRKAIILSSTTSTNPPGAPTGIAHCWNSTLKICVHFKLTTPPNAYLIPVLCCVRVLLTTFSLQFLWGLGKQGYRCEDCGYVVHKKRCIQVCPNNCGALEEVEPSLLSHILARKCFSRHSQPPVIHKIKWLWFTVMKISRYMLCLAYFYKEKIKQGIAEHHPLQRRKRLHRLLTRYQDGSAKVQVTQWQGINWLGWRWSFIRRQKWW